MLRTPHFFDAQIDLNHEPAVEIQHCLLAEKVEIPPKYFYDNLGSKLFHAITALPEYYPTRVEAHILTAQQKTLKDHVPRKATLVDLGAGDCRKAAALFEVLDTQHYVAVDISTQYLRDTLNHLQKEFPDLQITGVGTDFSETFCLPSQVDIHPDSPRVLFYPGSSISNFSPLQAKRFLQSLHDHCGPNPHSGLLIGVDLIKGKAQLEAAYDDALGVTAAFNKNMLLHLNQLIGANFKLSEWKHLAFFNTEENRIEMHLEALKDTTVNWKTPSPNQRQFAKGERMHTENSYKWTFDGFEALLNEAGFEAKHCLSDEHSQFAVYWAQVRKPQ